MAEAIESSFVPLCIYNNKTGVDATVLKSFKEPSWNNPVTRIIAANRRDVVPRNGNGWSVAAVMSQAVEALKKRGKTVPPWMAVFATESIGHARGVETAIFGMT